MIGEKYEDTAIGTPQGGNLSPLLANIMLNELDKELEARGLNFVRYADDCNIYVKSEKAAERVMKSITDYIERKLGLIVNAEKSRIGRPTQIKFLGFGYFKSKEKWEAKPHRKSILKLKRKLKALTKRSWSILLDIRLAKIKQLIVGWVNYFRIAKMKTVLSEIDQKLRKRIRVVIWKQWKVFKARYENLLKLGASKRNARYTAGCRKGYQYVCGTATIHSAISNERLKKRGLLSLTDHFNKVHLVTN
jgi:predicted XRE-type DNA-binding protein